MNASGHPCESTQARRQDHELSQSLPARLVYRGHRKPARQVARSSGHGLPDDSSPRSAPRRDDRTQVERLRPRRVPCRAPCAFVHFQKQTGHHARIARRVGRCPQCVPSALRKAHRWSFRGLVPRVQTMMKGLKAAEIPLDDEPERRVELHALRHTFITRLSASGAHTHCDGFGPPP